MAAYLKLAIDGPNARHRPKSKRLAWIAALFLFTVLGSTSGCSLWELGAERDLVRNGIGFESLRENSDGSSIGKLAEDTVIEGWPCRQGFVAFHAGWRLDECHLSREYERNGIVMPEGTRVFPDKAGNPGICMFPHDTNVQGYLCRGSRSGGFMTAFYASGRLHWFYSRDPVMVNGITCKNSLFEAIYLHPDSRLRQCQLDQPVALEGKKHPRGAVIHLDQTGALISK